MNRTLLFVAFLSMGIALNAQSLTEETGLKFYEHHSSSLNGGATFGGGANGSQSGYDFVNRTYFNSFDPSTFGEYQNGEEANIDMVEHKGPFGGAGSKNFGFTAGTSSIWGGEIKGNGTTRWVEASAGFDYANATTVAELVNEYNAAVPDSSVDEVMEGAVYIARIRNSNLYVAIKCYNLDNHTPGVNVQDVSFEFDYKYGEVSTVGIDENKRSALLVYPNPARDIITISNPDRSRLVVTIMDTKGQILKTAHINERINETLDISSLSNGVYIIRSVDQHKNAATQRFVKN